MSARVIPGLRRPTAILLLLAMVVAGLLATPAEAALPGGERIGDDEAPTAASIDIAQRGVADGAATRVVLGRNDVFPDNLAGSAAAGVDGVLLLVDPAPAGLDEAVATELVRLLGAPSEEECADADVVLLGGESALGTELADDLIDAGWCIDRLAGPSRVETAIDIPLDVVGDGPARPSSSPVTTTLPTLQLPAPGPLRPARPSSSRRPTPSTRPSARCWPPATTRGTR